MRHGFFEVCRVCVFVCVAMLQDGDLRARRQSGEFGPRALRPRRGNNTREAVP